jgi:DNA (cytosine-5)-methyltransferase 1
MKESAAAEKLTTLDLFSGVGGFSLGLERTGGFETAAFCEIDEFCRRVLAKHWPLVPRYDDVRTLTAQGLGGDWSHVDVICGGFPCQDISTAGRGAGIADGTRSGLWAEYARLVGEIRPRYVIVENVSALLGRGMGRVLGDLAEIGYDAEWHVVPASAVGAPHERERERERERESLDCGLPLRRWTARSRDRGRSGASAWSLASSLWWAISGAS